MGMNRYRGRIAKFSTNDAINKELVLLVDVEVYVEDKDTWNKYRDHLWLSAKGFSRSKQNNITVFLAKEYTYGIEGDKLGLTVKAPKTISYYKGK